MDYEFTEDWFTGNIPNWTRWLDGWQHRRCRVLEIGCFEGRATVWLLEHVLLHEHSKIFCVDSFEFEAFIPGCKDRFLRNTKPWSDRVNLIIGESRDVVPQLKTTFDLIYVDGSHVADDVYSDGILSWPHLNRGGIMIFDDYNWTHVPNPKQKTSIGIDRFLAEKAGQLRLINKDHQVAIRKESR